jgi:hypothetical protein
MIQLKKKQREITLPDDHGLSTDDEKRVQDFFASLTKEHQEAVLCLTGIFHSNGYAMAEAEFGDSFLDLDEETELYEESKSQIELNSELRRSGRSVEG